MEEEVINDINFLLSENIYQESEQWNIFKAKLSDPEYMSTLFDILLFPQSSHIKKILCISALLQFKISPPQEIIPRFFPLLYDPKYQQLISHYIVGFCDQEYLCQFVLPSLYEEVQGQEGNDAIVGLILCFYEYVRVCKVRDETVLQILFQFLVERSDLPIESRKKALESIILQLNLIDVFNDKETLEQDVKNIMTFFIGLPIDDDNFPLFDYLLYFIKTAIIITEFGISSYEHEILQKIDQIFDYLVEKAPLDPEENIYSTILFYSTDIIETKKFTISFEKIFPLLIIGPKQFEALQSSADYFFGVFIGESDDFNFYSDEIDDDDDDEDEVPDENGVVILEDDPFKIFKTDFPNDSRTLSDSQCCLMNYLSHQTDEYISESIQYCLSAVNDSINTNILILRYFIKQRASYPIIFNPYEFNCYEDPILQTLLLEFCQSRANISKEIDSSDNLIYISYIKEFTCHDFIKALVDSDNSVLVLCAFNLINIIPKEFIDQYIFETVLKRSLLIVLDLSESEIRYSFIEHIFPFYLVQGDTMDKEDEDKKFLCNEDPTVRRFICDSIFSFPDEYVSAFKEDSESFFGEVLHHLFASLSQSDACFDPNAIIYLSEILYYFAGRNMNQYVNRFRDADNALVNMENSDLFFEEISELVPEFVMKFLSDSDLLDCGYALFAYSFINFQNPNNEDYSNFIDSVYHIFSNDVNYFERNRRNPEFFEMIMRIFIKNEKYENIDTFCQRFLYYNPIHVRSLIYQLSFILINKFDIYSLPNTSSIIKFLLRTFIKEVSNENSDSGIIISIGIIFARLSLSYSKDQFEEILDSFPYSKEISTTDLFLNSLFEKIGGKIAEWPELIQKLIIAMYHLLSDHENAPQKAQFLLYQLVNKVGSTFSNHSEYDYFLTATYGLVKESIFYEDLDFLVHPLISAKICDLIGLIVTEPLNQEIGETFQKFIEAFPNL